jgi:multidrug transporter EmrE-like cation transporter
MCNGFGDYFIAIATQPKALGSSVTFPIINGGTILFSTLIGVFLYKEKLTVSTVISLVLVLVATVTFMFV